MCKCRCDSVRRVGGFVGDCFTLALSPSRARCEPMAPTTRSHDTEPDADLDYETSDADGDSRPGGHLHMAHSQAAPERIGGEMRGGLAPQSSHIGAGRGASRDTDRPRGAWVCADTAERVAEALPLTVDPIRCSIQVKSGLDVVQGWCKFGTG